MITVISEISVHRFLQFGRLSPSRTQTSVIWGCASILPLSFNSPWLFLGSAVDFCGFSATQPKGSVPNAQACVFPLMPACLCPLDGRKNAQ